MPASPRRTSTPLPPPRASSSSPSSTARSSRRPRSTGISASAMGRLCADRRLKATGRRGVHDHEACARASPRAIAAVAASSRCGAPAHVRSLRPHAKELDMTDPRHLLLAGTGPGLGAAIARRFARERYRLTLVARSEETIATLAQELRAEGTDVAVVQADAGDPERLRAALSPLVTAPDAPGVAIYNAALMAFDELLTVSPEQLADAYAVDVIGGVLTAQLAVPAMRAAGGGTLLFTGGGFA